MRLLIILLLVLGVIYFPVAGFADPLEKEKTYVISVDSSVKKVSFSVIFKPKNTDKIFAGLEKMGLQNFYLQPEELDQFSKLAIITSGENIYLINDVLEDTLSREILLFTPSGRKIAVSTPGVEFIDWSAGMAVSILNPEPGDWRLAVVGPGNFSLRVNARTDIHFIDFDFIKFVKRPGNEGYFPISKEPAIDAKQALELNFSEDPAQSAPPSFGLMDENGKMIDAFKTYTVQRGVLAEFAGVIKVPMQDFHILATGVDGRGFKYQRISPLIKPKNKLAPLTEMEITEFLKDYEVIESISRN